MSKIMVIPDDIEEFVEKHIKLMISQTETYLPFIKIVFPYSNNVADSVYNLIIGSALSVFVNQFTMKMKNPTVEDFTDFGKIALKYRDQIDQFFK
jgi:PhoPQ-activated pathogenicity-related protein|tara:strand:- start:141 stop:425 length:285 start_codon:yes stop_codon:yes gene_type:complete